MKLMNLLVILVSFSLLTACGSTSQKVGNYALVTDATGLVQDDSIEPAVLFIRPDAPALSSYNRFIIDPVNVRYDDPSTQKIAAEDLSRMQAYFQNQVASELRAIGKTITDQPGEDTMRISFTLSGIYAPSALPNVAAVLIAVSPAVGEVTIEAAFIESKTDRVDAIVIDRARGSRALNASPWSTWADIENTFNRWARGIAAAAKP